MGKVNLSEKSKTISKDTSARQKEVQILTKVFSMKPKQNILMVLLLSLLKDD